MHFSANGQPQTSLSVFKGGGLAALTYFGQTRLQTCRSCIASSTSKMKTSLLVLLVVWPFQMAVEASEPSCSPPSIRHDDLQGQWITLDEKFSWIWLTNDVKTHFQAQKTCEEWNTTLVMPRTRHIFDLLQKEANLTKMWIGLKNKSGFKCASHKECSKGPLEWADGSQADNLGCTPANTTVVKSGTSCLTLNNQFTFYEEACLDKLHFACQFNCQPLGE
jgi:hypothetical protein